MHLQKYSRILFVIISTLLFQPVTGSAQSNDLGKLISLVSKRSPILSYLPRCFNCLHISGTPSEITQNNTLKFQDTTRAIVSKNRRTTSLTVGNIIDEFSVKSDDGSYRFAFDGNAKGFKISSKSLSLMISYGFTNALENEGDIRSITADLSTGGNIIIFRNLFEIPIRSYIPIRANIGYRNLSLLDSENNNAHIGTGSLGTGVGSEIRLRTKKTVLNKNLVLSASLLTSAGAIGDFNVLVGNTEHLALSDIRLTKGTDYNFEIKLEQLIGRAGITCGLTVRYLYWTQEGAEEIRQILDVITGKRVDLELRGKQTFFRIGINL